MTDSELTHLRRQQDQDLRNFAKTNSESITALREDMHELYQEIRKISERLFQIESGQAVIAVKAAKEATRETLSVFGLSPEDPKGIEETRATLRFVKGAHNTVKTAWTVGFTFALTAVLGAIAVKYGWKG